MFEAPETPRPHWRTLFERFAAMPGDALRDRLRSVQREVRDNGVTYNVYADPQGADRPWNLDVLPFVLSAQEWSGIERAIAQRARLFNVILDDLYGAQHLLAEGLLPAPLVFGHAGFLRACRGAAVPGGVRLHLYAADLARAPDGRWWVVEDRTQAPSGAGYALENRLIISRLFPDLFRELKVQRLASFFAALREGLAKLAPRDPARSHEEPLIVLLTPGPHNETYFEHAYLARYLGFPLVEGGDLTVRDARVWLKTLSGLRRVHAILRRLDDDYCDPLELRGDSSLGIPGLVQAVHRGNVLVANALGSGLLESGMLLGYLPGLCQQLLGEPLAMPSIATWWCGEAAALEDVIARLDRLSVRPAFPQLRLQTVHGEALTRHAREDLVHKLRARPHDYVAQELMHLSQVPLVDPHRARHLVPGAASLRVYACATPNGYVVMPGGLTRVTTAADSRLVSMQSGGGSKDTWVLSSGEVNALSLLRHEVRAADLVRTGVNLSSRVAENLYWFGRYTERSDAAARLLRVALARMIDQAASVSERGWPAILALLEDAGFIDPEAHGDDITVVRALRSAIGDDTRAGLASNLTQLFRVAQHLRERMSADNWRHLNQMMRDQMRRDPRRHNGQPLALLDAMGELDHAIASLMTLAGFALDGMTRDQGWRLLSLGRRIERLQGACSMLLQALRLPEENELDWLLELADSSLTYRSRYRSQPQWLPVLDLLILDEANPRSVAFQLLGIHDYLRKMSTLFGEFGEATLEPLDASVAALRAIQPERDLRHRSENLITMLENWRAAGHRLSEQLGLRFFSHAGEFSRQTFAS